MGPNRAFSSKHTPCWLPILALSLVMCGFIARDYEKTRENSRIELVNWHSETEAIRLSTKTHKPILYFFTESDPNADDANEHYDKVGQQLFTSPVEAQKLNYDFICVRIDRKITGGNSEEKNALQDAFGVGHLPTLVVSLPARQGFRVQAIFGTKSIEDFLEEAVSSIYSQSKTQIKWRSYESALKETHTSHKPLLIAYKPGYVLELLKEKHLAEKINEEFIPMLVPDKSKTAQSMSKESALFKQLVREWKLNGPKLVILSEEGNAMVYSLNGYSSYTILDFIRTSNKKYKLG